MVCVFHISELWWGCSKSPCAWRVLFTLYFGLNLVLCFLVAWRTFSCPLTWDFSISDFESPSIQFPGAWPTLFLSSSFSGLTRDPKLGEENSSLHWLRITRLTGLAFAVVSTWHQSQCALKLERASFRNGYKNTSRKLIFWTNTEGDSIHVSRNFFWSECQRVSLWCQHIWFGFWVPNWFCQTTNQEQCGFWTRVSSLDFVL